MYNEEITIDIEALRRDLKDDSLGAFFCGGFGGALMETSDIERASDEKLIEMAEDRGMDLRRYQM